MAVSFSEKYYYVDHSIVTVVILGCSQATMPINKSNINLVMTQDGLVMIQFWHVQMHFDLGYGCLLCVIEFLNFRISD